MTHRHFHTAHSSWHHPLSPAEAGGPEGEWQGGVAEWTTEVEERTPKKENRETFQESSHWLRWVHGRWALYGGKKDICDLT